MTMLDNFSQLEATTMTTFTTTVLSGSWLDASTVMKDLGAGRRLSLKVNISTALAGIGAVEYQVILNPGGITTVALMGQTVTFTGSSTTLTFGTAAPSTGALVVFSNSGGGLPAAVTAGQTYFFTQATATTGTIASTLGGTAITFATAGTPTHTATIVPIVLGSSGPIPVEVLPVGATVTVPLKASARLLALPGWIPAGYSICIGRWIERTVFPDNAAPLVTGAITAGKWSAYLIDGQDEVVNYGPRADNPP